MTRQGLRGVILLLTVLAILAAGIASVRVRPSALCGGQPGPISQPTGQRMPLGVLSLL